MRALALDGLRARFPSEIQAYYLNWIRMPVIAQIRQESKKNEIRKTAEEVVVGTQRALMLARSLLYHAISLAHQAMRQRTRRCRVD